MKRRISIILLSLGTIVTLAACSTSNTTKSSTTSTEKNETTISSTMDSMAGMNHDGVVPDGMKDDSNPKFPIGSSITLLDDHMDGMNGADGYVVGAYKTTIYEVSYDPTNGGKKVSNHKWVVQEELKDPTNIASKGDTVILNAEHMDGMMGATATVDDAINGTVYVVDYTPTNGDEMVQNHMWVTEDEMKINEKGK